MESIIELEDRGVEEYVNKQIQEAMTRLAETDPELAQMLHSERR